MILNQGRENTSQDLLRVTVYGDTSAMVGNPSAFLTNVELSVVVQSGYCLPLLTQVSKLQAFFSFHSRLGIIPSPLSYNEIMNLCMVLRGQ